MLGAGAPAAVHMDSPDTLVGTDIDISTNVSMAAGIDLPYSCRAGACSSCAGKIESGEGERAIPHPTVSGDACCAIPGRPHTAVLGLDARTCHVVCAGRKASIVGVYLLRLVACCPCYRCPLAAWWGGQPVVTQATTPWACCHALPPSHIYPWCLASGPTDV